MMKYENEDKAFVYRSYQKSELTQLYYPMLTPKVAMRKFNTWLRCDPQRYRILQRHDITVSTKIYRRSQVSLIVKLFGEP